MSEPSWAVHGDVLRERDRVELSLPARPELLFLLRMTAAAVASRAGFGYDQIDALRLAVDELALGIRGDDDGTGRLQLLFEWAADAMEVVGVYEPDDKDRSVSPDPVPPVAVDGLSARILDSLVDEHGADVIDGCPRAWLRMHRRERGPK